jgi:undecaprenyl-diphosphatase
LFAVATFSLWLLDRPGPWYRWKVACLSGLTAAGLGLALSQVITHFYERARPFDAHPHDTLLLLSPSHEPSFPSDHAIAAFAIACSVAFVSRRVGAFFLAGATMIGIGRILVGLHYPGDIAGGALIGLMAAGLVFWFSDGRITGLVGLASRVTDPLVRPGWRALDRAKAARRRAGRSA